MRILIFLTMMTMMGATNGQGLSSHQWKNRLVLVFSQTMDSDLLKTQLAELNRSPEGLEDRKLLIYQVLPDQYRTVDYAADQPANTWVKSSELYKRFSQKDEPFRFILIGLDGGVKVNKKTLFSIDELFETIDVMPMRRSELRDGN